MDLLLQKKDLLLQKKIEKLNRLKDLLAKKKANLAKGDLALFVKFFLKDLTPIKTPEFHREMMAALNRGFVLNELNRILFIAPRGFAKSHICSIFLPIFLACYGLRKDILIVSATISLAESHLRKIRLEFEQNSELIRAFGDLKSDKWTEKLLVFKNGVQIRAKGRGFQIRGFRPDCIILDDLEDDEVIYSKEQREKLEEWFFRTLLPSLQPNQNLLYVGTKIHQFSLINRLEKKEEFFVRKYQALVDGKSIWEELWSTESLKKLRKEIGSYAFEAEYQNNPISLAEQPVKPYFLENVNITGERELRAMAIDPAISEKTTSDFRAIVIFDRTPNGFKEVFSEKGKWTLDEQIKKIIDLYVKYNPDKLIIEEVAFQRIFRKLLVDEAKKRRIYLKVLPAELGVGANKRPKDKLTRLLEIVHLFEQRLVEVRNPELIEELLAFPFGDYDDMVDACVYALYWLSQNKSGGSFFKKEEFKVVEARPSFYLEEVRPGVFYAKEFGEPKPPRIKTNFINYDKN